MSRLIDADLLKAEYFVPSSSTNNPNYLYVSMKTINDAPTIDAVEVVRCKDCKKRYTPWCFAHRHGESKDDFFCADGEVKNDEIS